MPTVATWENEAQNNTCLPLSMAADNSDPTRITCCSSLRRGAIRGAARTTAFRMPQNTHLHVITHSTAARSCFLPLTYTHEGMIGEARHTHSHALACDGSACACKPSVGVLFAPVFWGHTHKTQRTKPMFLPVAPPNQAPCGAMPAQQRLQKPCSRNLSKQQQSAPPTLFH